MASILVPFTFSLLKEQNYVISSRLFDWISRIMKTFKRDDTERGSPPTTPVVSLKRGSQLK